MKHTIWVLEDNDAVRKMISLLLMDLRFKVYSYGTSTDLLNQLKSPEQTFSDINSTGTNAINICLLISEKKFYDDIPILAIQLT